MRQQLSDFKADFFKALAHPLRISILDALRDGELTVNEISQRFNVEPANASQQLGRVAQQKYCRDAQRWRERLLLCERQKHIQVA